MVHLRRALAAGLLAAAGLFVLYLTVRTLASGWSFTRAQLSNDAPFLALLVPMFGAQVGAYAWMRSATRMGAGGGATAANGG